MLRQRKKFIDFFRWSMLLFSITSPNSPNTVLRCLVAKKNSGHEIRLDTCLRKQSPEYTVKPSGSNFFSYNLPHYTASM